MRSTAMLRKLLEKEDVIIAPGAYDALSAKIIEKAGFKAVGTTGYGMEASMLGLPDVGFTTMSEIVRQCRNIASAVEIPVMCDADTGYGNSVTVAVRTVKEFEKAGVAGIYIEDQALPKRCPLLLKERPVIPMEEMVNKIKAALEARDDPDFIIVARIDARGEEQIKRGKAYKKAGADLVKPICFSISELKRFADAVKAPIHTNPSTIPIKDFPPEVKIVTIPTGPLRAAAKAMTELVKEVKRRGLELRNFELDPLQMPTEEFHDLVGFPKIIELEKKYVA